MDEKKFLVVFIVGAFVAFIAITMFIFNGIMVNHSKDAKDICINGKLHKIINNDYIEIKKDADGKLIKCKVKGVRE